jgi:hypothetical protein
MARSQRTGAAMIGTPLINTAPAFDPSTVALGARLTTALIAVNQLFERPDMAEHHSTLGGVHATLRYHRNHLPMTRAAWYDLHAAARDLRDLWSPTRVGRGGEPNPTANLLCIADQQLQGAARLIADVLEGR